MHIIPCIILECLKHMCPPHTHAAHTCLCILFSSLPHFISHMLLDLQHDACFSCVLPLPHLFKLFSMLTTPFLLPIFLHSYRTLFFLSFTASHLLQPSCSSFYQQSFIMPFIVQSMLFSLFISLFTFILPIVLLSLLFMLAVPFLLFIQSMLLPLLIAILYCSSFGLCQ